MNEEYKPIANLWKDSEGYRYFGTLKLSSKIKYNGDDFIPLWEWVKQLQQENKHLDGVNCKLRRKIGQLEDNWNELRKKEINRFNKTQDVQFLDVLQDMQELERGSNYDK